MPLASCAYITNEKKHIILEFEARYKTRILLIPNTNFDVPEFKLQSKVNMPEYVPDFLELTVHEDTSIAQYQEKAQDSNYGRTQKALVKHQMNVEDKPAAKKDGVLTKLINALAGSSKPTNKKSSDSNQKYQSRGPRQQSQRRSGSGNRNRRRSNPNRAQKPDLITSVEPETKTTTEK